MKILLPIWFSMLLAAHVSAQKVPVYENFDDFQGILHQNNDTTYVINFWATYCAPCIEEMSAFRKLEDHYKDQSVEIILTSLDFGNNVKERVRAFMKQHNVQSRVVILDDPDGNSWIGKVSDKWSGALPGTLIYNRNSREFYEKTFTYNELQNIVQSKMNEP